jgi:hypothetical protein
MFRKLKKGYVAGIAAALLVVSVQACSAPLPTAPTLPASEAVVVKPGQAPVDLSLGGLLGGAVSTTTGLLGTTVNSVTCVLKTVLADIGEDGGTISVCGYSLVVPAHSLHNKTQIQLVPVAGQPGVVQFYPEGLQFAPSAKPTLTLSTDGVPAGASPYIVYTDDNGVVREVEATTGRTAHSVSAQIGHFSRYAVAW